MTGPAYEPIIVTRHLGQPPTIDTRPQHTKVALNALVRHLTCVEMPEPDLLVIAHQTAYRVTGYDPADCTLTLELVEGWPCTCGEPQGDDEDDAAARSHWQHSRSCPLGG